ncbi:hypothetical protein T09_534 [Trichinella sp. T9]|nr:hypothetical protein T09_534 [Trichinella sp. T9]
MDETYSKEHLSSFAIQQRYRTLLPILMYKEIALVLVWYGILSLCFSLGYWVSRRRKSPAPPGYTAPFLSVDQST